MRDFLTVPALVHDIEEKADLCKPLANLGALSTPSYLSTRVISRGYVGWLLRRQGSAINK